jgi:hypothetical protein
MFSIQENKQRFNIKIICYNTMQGLWEIDVGTTFYDVIALAHCTVVCDTGTINLPNRLLDIKI